jgi:hypothetical protein
MWLSWRIDGLGGPRLDDFRPDHLGLPDDRTLIGGRLPPGAVGAEALERRTIAGAGADRSAARLHRSGGGRVSARWAGHRSGGRVARVDRGRSDQRRGDPGMRGPRRRGAGGGGLPRAGAPPAGRPGPAGARGPERPARGAAATGAFRSAMCRPRSEHGAYRASEIALYSSYQLPPPAAGPGTDKRMRGIAAIRLRIPLTNCRTSVE